MCGYPSYKRFCLYSMLFTDDRVAALLPRQRNIGMLLYVQSKGDSGLPRAGGSVKDSSRSDNDAAITESLNPKELPRRLLGRANLR